MLNSLSLVSNHFQINEKNKHFSILCLWSKIQKDRNFHKFSQFFMKKLTHFWSFFSNLLLIYPYGIFHCISSEFFLYLQTLLSFFTYEITDTVSKVWYLIKKTFFCEKGETIGNSVRCILVSMTFIWLVLN